MNHKLRITVDLDLELRSARIEVHGCLTEENCHALMPIIRRCFRILREPCIVIDTSKAQHIDREGVEALRDLSIGRAGLDSFEAAVSCSLLVPEVLPLCPARISQQHGSGPYL